VNINHKRPIPSVCSHLRYKNGVEPFVHALRLKAWAQAMLTVEALVVDVASIGVAEGHHPNEVGVNVHHPLEGDLCKFEY